MLIDSSILIQYMEVKSVKSFRIRLVAPIQRLSVRLAPRYLGTLAQEAHHREKHVFNNASKCRPQNFWEANIFIMTWYLGRVVDVQSQKNKC